MKKSGVVFLVFFGLFWTALVSLCDIIVGTKTINQIVSSSFPKTTGEITHSELTREDGEHGCDYGVDIRYHYEVAGQSFEGRRFRYNAGASSDSAWAQEAVTRYPVESHAEVFYNPRSPGDALLSPGVNGADLMMVIFLTPFTLIMLGFWYAAFGWLRGRFFPHLYAWKIIKPDGAPIRVRLPTSTPLVSGMIATGGLAFLAIFVLAFSAGFHPSDAAAWTALIVAYGAGVVTFIWQWRKSLSGDADLIIDEASRTVALPMTFARKERKIFGFSDISAVTVEPLEHQSDKGSISHTYLPTIHLKGSESAGEKLADWRDEKKAQSFADWLRQKFGLS